MSSKRLSSMHGNKLSIGLRLGRYALTFEISAPTTFTAMFNKQFKMTVIFSPVNE